MATSCFVTLSKITIAKGLPQPLGRRGGFDVVLVWASDRIARSVKHFLEVLDELNRLNIEFVSFREKIETQLTVAFRWSSD